MLSLVPLDLQRHLISKMELFLLQGVQGPVIQGKRTYFRLVNLVVEFPVFGWQGIFPNSLTSGKWNFPVPSFSMTWEH
jgi:hypothetical protein